jgi:hypothetical protein
MLAPLLNLPIFLFVFMHNRESVMSVLNRYYLYFISEKEIARSLQWVGDGRYRPKMMTLAKNNVVSERITFVGNVVSDAEVSIVSTLLTCLFFPPEQRGCSALYWKPWQGDSHV